MKWPFFQPQSHRPAHVSRKVFVAPSPSRNPAVPELYERTFPMSVSDAVILYALIEDVFWSLRLPPEGSHIEGPRPVPPCAICS